MFMEIQNLTDDLNNHNYELTSGSAAIDRGVSISAY